MNTILIFAIIVFFVGIITAFMLLMTGISVGILVETKRVNEEVLPEIAKAAANGELDIEGIKLTIEKEKKNEK